MRVVLILNPVSGISTIEGTPGTPEEHEAAILSTLQAYGIDPEVFHTTPEDTGQGLSTRVAAEGADIVIASGGDGTVHAVARGLIGTSSVLGIIPTGTMNNLAHSLNIPTTIDEACKVIAKGVTRPIDIGKVNESGRISEQVFLEVAGIGLEAALFPLAEEIKQPGLLSTLHGAVAGLFTLLSYKPPKLRISFDDRRRRPYSALQVTILNAPFYGMHLQVAENVLMDDGLLDVIIYKNFNKLEYIRHAISISQGRRAFERKIVHRRVKSLRIDTDQPVEIQVDGVRFGETPAEISVLHSALRVRVPGVAAPGLKQEEQLAEKGIQATTRVTSSPVSQKSKE